MEYLDTTKYREKILVGISFTVPLIVFAVVEMAAWRWALERKVTCPSQEIIANSTHICVNYG